MPSPHVLVSGPSAPTEQERRLAHEAGHALGSRGLVVLTGGGGGAMAAAAAGAAAAGGTAVALLPGLDRAAASPGHTVVVPTGLGELRNGLLVRAADVVLSVGGSWGTLSEVALAVATSTPVVWLAGWQLPEHPGLVPATSLPEALDAVAEALAALG